MNKTIKLSLSLLANQFLSMIAGFMCIIFVWLLAGDSIYSQIIFLLFTYPFFIYIEYHAAYKYGFHNPERRNAPESKKYILNGAIAGLISAIPLIIMICVFIYGLASGNVLLREYAKLYTRIISMYYNWPMCNIFPNHTLAVFLTSIPGLVIFPMLGYIAGYKNFMLSDKIFMLFKLRPKK